MESVADRINLTLHDFSTWRSPGEAPRDTTSCIKYATVREKRETEICGGKNMVTKQVYTSQSNVIDVIIHPSTSHYFMLEYSG